MKFHCLQWATGRLDHSEKTMKTSGIDGRLSFRWRCTMTTMLLAGAVLSLLSLSGQVHGQTVTQTRVSAFEYDPTSGLLKKEVIEPGQRNLCVVTEYVHNAMGQAQTVTTRNCSAGTDTEALAPDASTEGQMAVFESRTTTNNFIAAKDARFASETTVVPKTGAGVAAHKESRIYDSLGNVTKLTGPNGLITEWVYDSLGRKTLEKRADGTGTRWEYLYCSGASTWVNSLGAEYRINCPTLDQTLMLPQAGIAGQWQTLAPTRLVSAIRTTPITLSPGQAAIGPYSLVYQDELGRAIRSETQGDDSFGVAAMIVQDTRYGKATAAGSWLAKSAPYVNGGIAIWTVQFFDPLGRVIEVNTPSDDNSARVKIRSEYTGLTTRSIDPNGYVTTQLSNEAGQVVQITDAKGGVLRKEYDPQGNLIATQDARGNVTAIQYDGRGRKTAQVDPDLGRWSYLYNALGELKQQTDAKGQSVQQSYDLLGRLLQRVEPDLTSDWVYDTCAMGVGKLCKVSTLNGYIRSHSYDSKGRPSATTTTHAGSTRTYTASVSYDTQGRVDVQTYPSDPSNPASSFKTQAVYSSLGYLKEMRDGGGATLFSVTAKRNDAGQLTNYRYGSSGAATTLQYYVGSGRIKNIQAVAGSYTLQNLGLTYRADGLVQTRTDITINPTSYEYDELGRLTAEVRTAAALPGGSVTMGWTYDAIGNMTSRSEGGQTDFYQYNGSGAGSVRPHAVANVSGFVNGVLVPRYKYDANGNLLNGAGRTVTWTSYNKAAAITSGANQLSWLYDAEHERAQETLKVNGVVTRTTHYLNPAAGSGLFYEEETTSTGTLRKHYLTAAGVSIGVVKCAPGGACGAAQAEYWHADQLGSVSVVSSPSGQLSQTMAYEPFGKRRNASGLTDPNGTLASPTDRGFTGHEHLDEVGLINMNGRVYDPGLARFLSADPFIKNPGDLQGFNRYSYVDNNPLIYIDPTGHFKWSKFRDNWLKPMVAVAVAVWAPQISAYIGWTGPVTATGAATITATSGAAAVGISSGAVASGMLGGALSGAIMTGTVKGAVLGGLTGAAFGAVGDTWGSGIGNVAGHAAVGCASAAAGGGDCASGAMSAAVGSAWSNYGMKFESFAGNLAAHMVVGGTASVIGGGKFSNGAMTSAYGYLFNELLHQGSRREAMRRAGYALDPQDATSRVLEVLQVVYPGDYDGAYQIKMKDYGEYATGGTSVLDRSSKTIRLNSRMFSDVTSNNIDDFAWATAHEVLHQRQNVFSHMRDASVFGDNRWHDALDTKSFNDTRKLMDQIKRAAGF